MTATTPKYPFVKVVVKAEGANTPISGAYIWVNNVLKGRTDSLGVWGNRIPHGSTSTIKIVAKGYSDELVEKEFLCGQDVVLDITVRSEQLQPIVCSKCGRKYPHDTDKVFCTWCGTRLRP